MCNGSKAQTITTDPLSNQKTQAANSALNAYETNLPQLLGISKNLGNMSTSQAGFPDILNQANNAESSLLSTASGGPDSGPFATLKQNLLGTYDTGVQKYTLDPLKEQLINEGIYSSGPGMDAYQNAANQAATGRANLASQQDVNALNLEQSVIGGAQSMGSTIAGLLQQLGITNPMAAIAQSQQQPQFQDIATTQYTPQNGVGQIMQLLGQVAGPAAASMISGGTGGAGATPSGTNISQLLGMAQPGGSAATANTGLNFNANSPGGSNTAGIGGFGTDLSSIMPLLMKFAPMLLAA